MGTLKRELFYRDNPEYDVVYVVADDYHQYPRMVTHARVRFFPLSEPIPNKDVVRALLPEVILDVFAGKRVAIACAAGVNRSATIATVAHMAHTGKSFLMAMRDVRMQRPSACPFYWTARTVLDVAADEGYIDAEADREIEPITGKKDAYENQLRHHAP